MTISFDDAEHLKAAGFNDWEIAKLAEASLVDGKTQPPVNLSSPIWQRVLASRRDWMDNKIGRGWSPEDIDQNIMDYYGRSPKRTPFDFLKAEYRPIRKRDFFVEIRKRNQRKVSATMKGYY